MSCAVRHFDILLPVVFLPRLSEDVATRLSACYLISLIKATHRYLEALTKRDMLRTRALNLVHMKGRAFDIIDLFAKWVT